MIKKVLPLLSLFFAILGSYRAEAFILGGQIEYPDVDNNDSYYKIDGGINFPQKLKNKLKPKNSNHFSIAYGFRMSPNTRIDVAVSGRQVKVNKSYYFGSISQTLGADAKVTNFTPMLNGYWDFGPFGIFNPYVNTGLGISFNHMHRTYIYNGNSPYFVLKKSTRNGMAFQVGAGSAMYLGEGMNIDMQYKYFHTGSILVNKSLFYGQSAQYSTTTTPSQIGYKKLNLHEVGAGIRYNF